ncbi:hypothetical protein [Mesorhizobium sp. M0578]|uniref:hypothetical protein n=1 Tax=unclassified Mesorhizobium TaxID=325217 RepID=UPI0033397415
MRPSGAAASPRPATLMPGALVEDVWAYRMRARIGRHKVDRKSFAISGGKRKFDCAPDIVG